MEGERYITIFSQHHVIFKQSSLALSYASTRNDSSFLSYFTSTTPDSDHKRTRLKTILFLAGSSLYDPEVIRKSLLTQEKLLRLELAIINSKVRLSGLESEWKRCDGAACSSEITNQFFLFLSMISAIRRQQRHIVRSEVTWSHHGQHKRWLSNVACKTGRLVFMGLLHLRRLSVAKHHHYRGRKQLTLS